MMIVPTFFTIFYYAISQLISLAPSANYDDDDDDDVDDDDQRHSGA